LTECAAALDEAGDAAQPRSAPRSGDSELASARGWRLPIRIALALAPLALAALLLAHAHRGVPPGEPQPTMLGSHIPVPPPQRKRSEHAGARLAFRPPPPAPPPKTGEGEKAGGPFPPP